MIKVTDRTLAGSRPRRTQACRPRPIMVALIAKSLLVIAKLIIAALLLGIIASLFTSAFFLVKDNSSRVAGS